MTSLWLHGHQPETTGPPPDGERYDHVVVGAGITGLVSALLLARAGGRVAVLEARYPGAAATGNTTGKLSLLQGTRGATIAARHGVDTLRQYLTANREGMEWLLRYCAEHDVGFDREAAVTMATDDAARSDVDAEYRACRAAALPVQRTTASELPFGVTAAVELPDQAQLDPLPLLTTLVSDIRAHGGEVYTATRVRKVTARGGGTLDIRTEHGTVRAGSLVLATGTPILDRGGFFARLHARRSYAAAFDLEEPVPRSMYFEAGTPTVSMRYARSDDQTVLLVGGFGHDVGATRSAHKQHVQRLLEWTTARFPSARPRQRWSAQDYESTDALPYVGRLLPGDNRILVATGFAKWGLTNGTAAAIAISGVLLGSRQPWANPLRSWRPEQLRALPSTLRLNAGVALRMASGWGQLVLSGGADVPPAGAGATGRRGFAPEAAATVGGRVCRVRPICTHLGGALAFNDAEQSWDCPLHGSRFAADGRVLEGPATRALTRVDGHEREHP